MSMARAVRSRPSVRRKVGPSLGAKGGKARVDGVALPCVTVMRLVERTRLEENDRFDWPESQRDLTDDWKRGKGTIRSDGNKTNVNAHNWMSGIQRMRFDLCSCGLDPSLTFFGIGFTSLARQDQEVIGRRWLHVRSRQCLRRRRRPMSGCTAALGNCPSQSTRDAR